MQIWDRSAYVVVRLVPSRIPSVWRLLCGTHDSAARLKAMEQVVPASGQEQMVPASVQEQVVPASVQEQVVPASVQTVMVSEDLLKLRQIRPEAPFQVAILR